MKRSTANWTTAVAASALLAMPVGSWAQQASPTPSQTSRPAGAQADQKGSANEHLRQAEAALNDIPAASLTGTAKTKVAELKRHIAMLNKSASPAPAAGKTTTKASWATDVAAADRILTDLLGAGSTTGAIGTSGTTAAKPAGKTTAVTLDETAKAKLQEVRTHLTAFAASMSGTSAAPGATTPSADDSSSSASASATAAPAASATATAAPSATTTASSPAPAATPGEPSASASATPSPQAQSAQPAQSVDTEDVKRHLTAARDTLSQLTQIPAAAQLTGDSRTQVSQLISNFNELITTNTEWRASYGKLQANLNALLGDKSAAAPAAPATGTPGAVGTSGTTGLDPAVRAKLEEFRAHLTEFEKMAGGAAPMASAASSAPAASATTAAPRSDSTGAVASTAAPSSASPAPPSEPSPTATASTPSGASSPAASPESMPQSPAPQSSAHQGMHGQSNDAMRHIEAIEAILNGASPAETAGTSGSTAAKAKTPSSPSSLDRAQIEKIRTHLSELRKSLNK